MRGLYLVALSLMLSLTTAVSALAQPPDGTPGDPLMSPTLTQPEDGVVPEPAPSPDGEETVAPPAPAPSVMLSLRPSPQPTPNASQLSGTTSGSIDGNRAGSFAYASFYYPGDGTVSRITVNYSPNDINSNNGFGLNLYEKTSRAANLSGAGSSPDSPKGTSWVDYSSKTYKGIVTVQVYNYNSAGAITYTIRLSREAPSCASPIAWQITPGCPLPKP